ncbi:MAG: elongation factor Ts [Candidatus Hepatoplasma vulgare]|nr:MAG: elongation factor Ts [Candidatus Hepatoplasma sp.]
MSIEKIKKLREITKAGLSDIKKALENTNYDTDKAIIWLRENGVLNAAKKVDRIAAEGVIKIKKTKNKIVIIEVNSETDFVAQNNIFNKSIDKILNTIIDNNIKNLEDLEKLKIDNQDFKEYVAILISTIGEKINFRRFVLIDNLKTLNIGYYVHSNNRIGAIVVAKGIDEITLKDIAMHITAMSPEYLSLNDISSEKRESEYNIAKKELMEKISSKPEEIQKKIIDGKVSKNLSEIVLLEQPFIKDQSIKIKDLLKNGEILNFVRFEVGSGIEKRIDNFKEEVLKQANS